MKKPKVKKFRVTLIYQCVLGSEQEAETEQQAVEQAKSEVTAGQLYIQAELQDTSVREQE